MTRETSEDLDGVGMEAARFVVAERRTILRLRLAPVLVSALIWLVVPTSNTGAAVSWIADIAIYTVFAMSIHRFALMGEVALLPPLDRRALIFALCVIAESVVIAVAAVGGFALFLIMRMMALDGPSFLIMPFLGLGLLVAFAIALYVSARFIAAFPHVPITPPDKIGVSAALSLTEGNVKPIALRLVVFTLASYAATEAVTRVFALFGLYSAEGVAKLLYLPLMLIDLAVVFALLSFLVALASFIYRRLVDGLEARAETAPAAP